MLARTPHRTLTDQLAERFAERIRSRLLPAGSRLPSVRDCARQQGVSPHTVVAAYDQLLAQGLVEARRQRGFFVRDLTQNSLPGQYQQALAAPKKVAREEGAAALQPLPRGAHTHATALIRGMFHQGAGKPQPGSGVLPQQWLEEARFMPAALRKQIMTTVGATQALDIVSRTLLKAGDPVMVEEPGWSVEFARLDALGMRVLPVPRRADGPDLEVMARYCAVHAPRLYVSVSVLHNPTGHCLTPGHAHQVLQLAGQYGFHIVEDDTYSHIAPAHATRLSALDGLRRTIYVGGFAKILAPSWRVGYLAAPAELCERLLDTKLLSTLTTPSVLEQAMALCIDQGQLRRHAERMRLRLAQARARSVQLALEAGCRFAAEPAGLFGWVDVGVDTDVLAQRMLDEGYLLAPGALFHASRQPSTLMRINFSTTQDAAFWRVFARVRADMAPA